MATATSGMELEVDSREFNRQLAIYVQVVGRSMEEELGRQARLFLERAVRMTPPGKDNGGRGSTQTEARARGVATVRRDLRRLFRPVDLRGSRRLTHLFGRPVEPPWEIPQRERHPDVAAVYRSHRRKTRRGRHEAYRAGGNYVDRRKLAALEKALLARVGWLAGGWNPAARQLSARVPSWARRHGTAPGMVRVTATAAALEVYIRNDVRYAASVEGLRRRVQRALDAQARAMERQIPHLLRRHERIVN